jgi:hypothetical protein
LQSMHSNVRLSPSGPAGSISKSHIRESQLSHLGSSNRRGCGISLRVRMTSPLRPTFPPTTRLPGENRWSNHVHVNLAGLISKKRHSVVAWHPLVSLRRVWLCADQTKARYWSKRLDHGPMVQRQLPMSTQAGTGFRYSYPRGLAHD